MGNQFQEKWPSDDNCICCGSFMLQKEGEEHGDLSARIACSGIGECGKQIDGN